MMKIVDPNNEVIWKSGDICIYVTEQAIKSVSQILLASLQLEMQTARERNNDKSNIVKKSMHIKL